MQLPFDCYADNMPYVYAEKNKL